jgi:hypothetical protein
MFAPSHAGAELDDDGMAARLAGEVPRDLFLGNSFTAGTWSAPAF